MLGDKTTDGRDDAFNTSSPKQAKVKHVPRAVFVDF